VFDKNVLREIFHSDAARRALPKLVRLQHLLNGMFYDVERPVQAMVLAVATGESLLFLGPPGVAKSKLISTMCELMGVKPLDASAGNVGGPPPLAGERQDGGYFEYLLTPFTEPSELFGSLRIEDFGKSGDRMGRYEAGMIHRARVVFLDEVFNGSSAILNSLLALMNERRFHDRGLVKTAWLQTLFAASNARPRQPELQAAFDRFVFRVGMETVETERENVELMLRSAWAIPPRARPDGALESLLDDVWWLREVIKERRQTLFAPQPNDPDLMRLTYVIDRAKRATSNSFSNRRLVKLTEAMVYQRLLRGEHENDIGDAALDIHEFELAWCFFLDGVRLEDDVVSDLVKDVLAERRV
jgi:MoxR-like ATPase